MNRLQCAHNAHTLTNSHVIIIFTYLALEWRATLKNYFIFTPNFKITPTQEVRLHRKGTNGSDS